jgi:antitoxin ParD1/3/4
LTSISGSMGSLPSCSGCTRRSLSTWNRPDKNKDIASIRRQAAEGGLRFEAYLPPRLAAWVIRLVEQGVFHSPSEAVFVAMQSFRELDDHPDVKQKLLNRTTQKAMDAVEEGGGIPAIRARISMGFP